MIVAKNWTAKVLSSPVKNLAKFQSDLPKQGGRKLVAILAGKARTVIIGRTTQGLDVGNKPFTPYSREVYRAPISRRPPGYPKPTGGRSENILTGKPIDSMVYDSGYGQYKAGIGRGSKVQLNVSGKMLGAIQIALTGATTAVLFFAGREEAAKAHGHQYGTAPRVKREFFGIDGLDSRKKLDDAAREYLLDAAKRARIEIARRK